MLLSQISSRSAAQQMAASLILTEWGYLVHPALVFIPLLCLLLVALLSNICSRSAARSQPPCQPFPAQMSEALNSRLSSEEEYSEIESHRTKLYAECSVLIQSLVSVGIPAGSDLLPITEQHCIHKEVALQLVRLSSTPAFRPTHNPSLTPDLTLPSNSGHRCVRCLLRPIDRARSFSQDAVAGPTEARLGLSGYLLSPGRSCMPRRVCCCAPADDLLCACHQPNTTKRKRGSA